MRPVVAEDLLRHAAFVRALARSLLLDPHAADDVVQETWLSALESPPRHAGNLRGWLARVVSRQVLRRARGESRRNAHERASASGRAAPPADDTAARAETQRRLAEAVAGLEEPYREAVLLRYFDGLPPRAIARRLGVPVETVRTRLKRALATLRNRLDATHGGDRRSWALALAPLALRDATGVLGLVLRGGLLMSKRKMLAAAAALAVLGAGALVSFQALGEGGPKRRGEAAPVNLALAPAEVAAPRVAAAEGPYVHEGVVRDQEGRPVEGVRVVIDDALAPGERREARTDADGRFSVALPHPSDTKLVFRHPDCWSMEDYVRFRDERPEYTVRRGTPVRVTVLDGQGAPVAGAEVTLALEGPAMVLSDRRAVTHVEVIASGETGPDGVARLAGPEFELIVSAEHKGLSGSQRIEVKGPLATTVRLASDRAGAIEGRVLDAKGEPVAGARVFTAGPETRTDPEGRYRLEGVAGEVEVRAEAGARGVGGFGLELGWGHELPVRVRGGETVRDVDIVLRPGAWIRGRLVDETGRPLAGIGAKLWSNLRFPETVSARDGTFALGPCGVWQETRASLYFDTDGYASYDVREVEMPSFEHLELAPGGEVDLGTVVGKRRGTVRGRVLEADGTPARAGGVQSRDGRATPILPDGTFELAHVGPGPVTFHALVIGERSRRSEDREVAVAAGEVVLGIELVLGDPLVELKGRVVGKDGLPRDGLQVACLPQGASPEHAGYPSVLVHQGEFTLGGLRPGRYVAGVVVEPMPLLLEPTLEVEVGATGGYVELVVAGGPAGKIVGRVVDDRDGSPVESFNAELFRFEWFVPRHANSAWGDERFELSADEAGRYAVEIRADGYSGYRTPAFDLAEGATRDLGTIRLGPAGAVEVAVRDHAGAAIPYARAYALSSKLEYTLSGFTDTDGRVRLDDLNPGAYTLFVVSPRHPIGVVRDLAVGPGDVLRTEVNLPAAAPVTILVRDAAGHAVPGAELAFTFPALAPLDSSIAERYEPRAFGSNVADAEGRIRKPFLPTGEVTLVVTAKGFPPAKRTIDRGPGEATEVEIVLTR